MASSTATSFPVSSSTAPALVSSVVSCDAQWRTAFEFRRLSTAEQKQLIEEDPTAVKGDAWVKNPAAAEAKAVVYNYSLEGLDEKHFPNSELADFFMFPSQARLAHVRQLSGSDRWYARPPGAASTSRGIVIRYTNKVPPSGSGAKTAVRLSGGGYSAVDRANIGAYEARFRGYTPEVQAQMCEDDCRRLGYEFAKNQYRVFCKAAMRDLLEPEAVSIYLPSVGQWSIFLSYYEVTKDAERAKIAKTNLYDAVLLYMFTNGWTDVIPYELVKAKFTADGKLDTGLNPYAEQVITSLFTVPKMTRGAIEWETIAVAKERERRRAVATGRPLEDTMVSSYREYQSPVYPSSLPPGATVPRPVAPAAGSSAFPTATSATSSAASAGVFSAPGSVAATSAAPFGGGPNFVSAPTPSYLQLGSGSLVSPSAAELGFGLPLYSGSRGVGVGGSRSGSGSRFAGYPSGSRGPAGTAYYSRPSPSASSYSYSSSRPLSSEDSRLRQSFY